MHIFNFISNFLCVCIVCFDSECFTIRTHMLARFTASCVSPDNLILLYGWLVRITGIAACVQVVFFVNSSEFVVLPCKSARMRTNDACLLRLLLLPAKKQCY